MLPVLGDENLAHASDDNLAHRVLLSSPVPTAQQLLYEHWQTCNPETILQCDVDSRMKMGLRFVTAAVTVL